MRIDKMSCRSAARRLDPGACGGVGVSRAGQHRPTERRVSSAAGFFGGGHVWSLGMLLVGLSVTAGGGRAAGQCHYTYVTLPNPTGWVCHGNAINNLGHVAGQLDSGGDYSRAFVWTPETGTVQIPRPTGVIGMKANDINDLGHVVGEAVIDNVGTFAFFWDGQVVTILETVPGATYAHANAINSLDQIVGDFNFPGGDRRACLWSSGVFLDLGPMLSPAGSLANGINELGQIVGYVSYPNHAFRLAGQVVEWFPEPPGISQSIGEGLSNNGLVVGNVILGQFPNQYSNAFVWAPAGVEIIEPLDGSQNAFLTEVNDAGRAIGDLQAPSRGPLVWQNGHAANLRSLVVPDVPPGLDMGSGINLSGQIVAWKSGGSVVLNPVWTAGDLTGDCAVTFEDLAIVLSNFGSPQGSFPRGDVDLDGDVDLSDLASLLSYWGM